jgi:formylglycine-generating enzyme
MRVSPGVVGFLLITCGACAACGAFGSSTDDRTSTADGGGTTPPAPDAGATSDCPGTDGPLGVRVGSYCIDASEVTRGHYQKFLAAKGTDTGGQTGVCAQNDSYVPRRGWPAASGEERLPVIGVDWCDAFEFCRWAGKRLCGRIDGGAVAPSSSTDATKSQWFAACSKGGALAFPYGQTHDPSTCNGAKALDADEREREVKEYASCEGGYAGVFDMSGNAWEWEDSCDADGADPAKTKCRIRGGDFIEGPDTMGCGSSVSQDRIGDGRFGFRCCSP